MSIASSFYKSAGQLVKRYRARAAVLEAAYGASAKVGGDFNLKSSSQVMSRYADILQLAGQDTTAGARRWAAHGRELNATWMGQRAFNQLDQAEMQVAYRKLGSAGDRAGIAELERLMQRKGL